MLKRHTEVKRARSDSTWYVVHSEEMPRQLYLMGEEATRGDERRWRLK